MSASHDALGEFLRDVEFGFVDRTAVAPKRLHPQLVLNSESDSMLRALRRELRRCVSFTFSVAFVSPRAIALLKQELVEFVGVGRIITSDYLGFNSPAAFAELLNLGGMGIDVRLHDESAFHPKGYVFQGSREITAILGSSNLTENALARNHEWNLRVSATFDSDLADQFRNLLDSELDRSQPLTQTWLDQYAERYRAPLAASTRPARHRVDETVNAAGHPGVATSTMQPNSMQTDALASIDRMRRGGADKAIVISATGTGKTILSAMDVEQSGLNRVLFVAHREQILDRAMREFQRVLGVPVEHLGKFVGATRERDRRVVFATVQTLSQDAVLKSFRPDEFDYVLIDEVHRAGAASYARLIEYFTPKFLLGMTATPERSDGINVFELFDFNVPYEIRLNTALELDMLAPFHYYGVADITFEDGLTTSDATPLSRLVSAERIDHIIRAIETYGQAGVAPRGLIFCSRKEEACELSLELNRRVLHGRGLQTVALTGDDSMELREREVERLEAGELDYILTVDIFNEGVDIPSVNQVIMLRQTQSSIIFVQQLGRGLRKAEGKEYLVVIDFIGNYANNYLIPIALFGDDSLNRESLRKNLIAAEESGVLSGLSSVRFDRIAQQRVLQSLVETRLDSFQNLKNAIDGVRNRIGRMPALADFLRFESADPVLLATRHRDYPSLIQKLFNLDQGLSEHEHRLLSFVSRELMTAKRPHELTTLQILLDHGRLDADELAGRLSVSVSELRSVLNSLSLAFNTEPEKASYGVKPLVREGESGVELADELVLTYRSTGPFGNALSDVIETGLDVIAARYDPRVPFTVGRQYSRKDACRLLGWKSNMASTIYGYKVDAPTKTCPIFITHHKGDEVSASTAYEDELLDPQTLLWYTRSRRTLTSGEVQAITSNSVALHVFAKKDDAEGSDFYYLGRANASNAEQAQMADGGLPVVRMLLRFEQPIDGAMFDYFHPVTTV